MQPHFESIRKKVLEQVRNKKELINDIVIMREKMRNQLVKTQVGYVDIKQAAGGLVDIEFIVQYHVLAFANTYPELIQYNDNMRLLVVLAKENLLEQTAVDILSTSYQQYRSLMHRSALQNQVGLLPLERVSKNLQNVQHIWNGLFS
jgi:glutamate-ammonia-ligase adenylyltransferase